MSNGEKIIRDILKDNEIDFIQEYSFDTLRGRRKLRFDFAVFDENGKLDYLIEFQGRQHYEPIEYFGGMEGLRRQHTHDTQKRNFCESKKIPLLVFTYLEENKLDLDLILKRYDNACYKLYHRKEENKWESNRQ